MKYFILTVLLLFLFGCKNDNHSTILVDYSILQGKWEVTSALKNGKETKMLDRSTIDFHGSKVDANFCGAVNADYILNDSLITIKANSEDFIFKIKELSDDKLDIHLATSNYDFDIIFRHKS